MKTNWSYDSPMISKANTVADFIFLNLVYLVCCLPVVTIGAARTALAEASFSRLKEGAFGIAMFWKYFTKNLKSFLLPWLGIVILGAFLLFDAYLLYTVPVRGTAFFLAILILLIICFAMVIAHVFMMHAKFVCKFRYMLSNSVLISLAHPLRTAAVLILDLLPWLLFFFWPQACVFMTPVWLLCYFSVSGYIAAKIMAPVYARLSEGANE